MIVNLSIALTIDTDKLTEDEITRFAEETEWQGFPVNDENSAYMLAEEVARYADDFYGKPYTQAVKAEVCP